MAYQRRAPANGKPKLSPMLEARFMVAAGQMGLTPTDALTDAAERWIKWAEQTAPRKAYMAEQAAYEAGRTHTAPDPVRYGLPPDFGIPRHP